MVLDEAETTKLFSVRRTLMEMLKARNYLVADYEIEMTKQQFMEKYGENMTRKDLIINKARRNDSSDQIYVFFPEEPKVGVAMIVKFFDRMKSDKVNRAIIVLQNKLTNFARTAISKLCEEFPKFNLEVFQEEELLFNVTEHVLVPKHQVLTDEQKKALLEKYRVKQSQLPRIQVNDPVAKFYGMTRGQVVKITRPSETAGQYVIYRCVV